MPYLAGDEAPLVFPQYVRKSPVSDEQSEAEHTVRSLSSQFTVISTPLFGGGPLSASGGQFL